ncbi:ferric reductase NAD binding domain-containing protein [Mycena rosella]|uniref:ferric-chelate reductase (NADPH) n=1 Tax=Mycena rosella TaxID=1033263 RepID=A0AAD7DCG7_MYCRO|nr:ferric reductase NAD binding domain-containing protein [Mycena rosella]
MGFIWLTQPVLWHSSRDRGSLNPALTADQAALIQARWHNWYTADWDYGQTTLAFFCAAIAAAMVLNLASMWRARRATSPSQRAGVADRLTAAFRYLTSRQFRVRATGYYAPPLSAIFGVSIMAIFVLSLMLAPRPYYWASMAMGDSQPIATRSGWISIAIMPFMIAFATKVNLVGMLTGTSHEKLQVFHRWSAVLMYITSLVHTFPFIVMNIREGQMMVSWETSSYYWTGVAALVPQTYLITLSWGIFRNRYYEIFKKLHFIASGIFMAALFIHVDWTLTSWDYFFATAAIYTTVWLARVLRTLATTRLGLPAAVTRATPTLLLLRIPAPGRGRLAWAPGQHLFLRVAGLGAAHALTSHPFTIASVHADGAVQLVLRVNSGLTRAIVRAVDAAAVGAGAAWATRVVVDGPYGGVRTALAGYDRVYLLAGGSGATFTLPLLTALAASLQGCAACRHVEFVVAVRDRESYAWMADAVRAAVALVPAGRIAARVHVTGADADADVNADADADAKLGSKDDKAEIGSDTDTECLWALGRPDLPQLVHAAAHAGAARVAVVSCGPDAFLYDVRNAVADVQRTIVDGFAPCAEMFLHTESYSW